MSNPKLSRGLAASRWASSPSSSSSSSTTIIISTSASANTCKANSPTIPSPVCSPPVGANDNNGSLKRGKGRGKENLNSYNNNRNTTAITPLAAPVQSTPVSSTDPSVVSAQELARYSQLVRRLKWKLPLLATGYHRASDAAAAATQSPTSTQLIEEAAEADVMFKLDFFEYYMLLERALVHLLGVFSVTISATAPKAQLQSRHRPEPAQHSYHQNVLAALDSADNPLHEVLGKGSVRKSLARAKELRNRWKYAEDDPGTISLPKGSVSAIETRPPLEKYDLERTLEDIFAGFDTGYGVATAWVQNLAGGTAEQMEDVIQAAKQEEEKRGENWDFMVDAMDWEAV